MLPGTFWRSAIRTKAGVGRIRRWRPFPTFNGVPTIEGNSKVSVRPCLFAASGSRTEDVRRATGKPMRGPHRRRRRPTRRRLTSGQRGRAAPALADHRPINSSRRHGICDRRRGAPPFPLRGAIVGGLPAGRSALASPLGAVAVLDEGSVTGGLPLGADSVCPMTQRV